MQYPDLPAVVCGSNAISYSQLDKLSEKMAATLREGGVQKGDRVGVFMLKSIESIVAMFAILKAGAVYVPIDWFVPMERLTFIIENCAMKALVTSTVGIGKIASEKTSQQPFIPLCLVADSQTTSNNYSSVAGNVVLREAIDKQNATLPAILGIIDRDLAYILYTSGSTGSPKGVMFSHLNALVFIEMAVEYFKITSQDRLVNHAPLHFDLSVFDVFCAIKAGGCVVLLTEKETMFPPAVLAAISRHRITIWNSVPSALIQLVQRTSLDAAALSSLRLVLFAGELFPPKYLRILMQKLPNATHYNMYGQTEANSSTCYKIETVPEQDDEPLPIGKAFPNYAVFALDDSGSVVTKPGERGELYVRGSTIALGYWLDEKKTALNFVPNPLQSETPEIVYKTGDIVTIDDKGNYVYIGRNDNIVKCRGSRVDIGDIESTLYKFPGVAQAAVAAIPDDEIGNRLIGFIIPEADRIVLPDDLKAFCAQKIPRYMVPETIILSISFPRTSTGKIDRHELIKLYLNRIKAV